MKLFNFNEDEYVVIGKIVNTHGLEGVLKANVYNDDLHFLDRYSEIFVKLENNDIYTKVSMEDLGDTSKQLLIRVNDIYDVNEAKKFIGADICITQKHLEENSNLNKDEYYIKDLIGIDVYTVDNKYLGIVKDVLTNGPYDTFYISR